MRDHIIEWIGHTLQRMKLCKSAESIEAGMGLYGKGIGLDSIEVLQIVTAVEDEFELTLDDDELEPEHFRTVGSLASFIEQRIQ